MKYRIQFLTALCCGLAACGTTNDEAGTASELVEISISDASLTLDEATATRAATGPLGNGASIGVFMLNTSSTGSPGYTQKYNVACTNNGGTWTFASPLFVDSRVAQLAAYYKDNSTVTFQSETSPVVTAGAFAVQRYKTDGSNQMWYFDNSQTSVKNTAPTATFTLKPAYSLLTLSLTKDAAYVFGPGAVTNVTVSGYYKDVTFNLANGTTTQATAGSFTDALNATLTATANKDFAVLLPPQTLPSAGITVTLLVDGAAREVTVPGSAFPGGKLLPGETYTLNLTLSKGVSILFGSNSVPGVTTGGGGDSLQLPD